MAKQKEKIHAKLLRRKGFSITEISKKLKVSKSTISLWCRDIVLTKYQRKNLARKMKEAGYNGRIKGGLVNRQKRLNTIDDEFKRAEQDIGCLSERDLLVAGTALYWAEGAKTSTTSGFSFMNSDPKMILIMKRFLTDNIGVSNKDIVCTVQINKIHQERIGRVLKYWASLLELPIEQFNTPYYVNVVPKKIYENHDSYYGVLRLKVKKSSKLKYYTLGLIKSMSG